MSNLRVPTDSDLASIRNNLFHHDGRLYWRDTGNNSHMHPPNQEAGYDEHRGGTRGVVCYGKSYKAHRVIWYLVTGAWPQVLILHKNGDKMDNRFKNLEEETFSERGQRTEFKLDNTLGIHGIRIRKSRGKGVLTYLKPKKFEARIGLEKGTLTKNFTNLTDACMWLTIERHRLGFTVSHVARNHYGQFSPTNVPAKGG